MVVLCSVNLCRHGLPARTGREADQCTQQLFCLCWLEDRAYKDSHYTAPPPTFHRGQAKQRTRDTAGCYFYFPYHSFVIRRNKKFSSGQRKDIRGSTAKVRNYRLHWVLLPSLQSKQAVLLLSAIEIFWIFCWEINWKYLFRNNIFGNVANHEKYLNINFKVVLKFWYLLPRFWEHLLHLISTMHSFCDRYYVRV